MIEAELERQRAANRLFDTVEKLRAAAKDDFGKLTEAEVMSLVNNEVRGVRADV